MDANQRPPQIPAQPQPAAQQPKPQPLQPRPAVNPGLPPRPPSAGTPRPNPGYKTTGQGGGEGSKWKFGALGVVGLIAVKVLIKLGMGVAVGTAAVHASKYESWSTDFKKELVAGCNTSAVKSIKEKLPPSVPDSKIQTFAASYCNCMADKVEGAHIIRTRYNQLTESAQTVEQEMVKVVDGYLESPEGKAALDLCANESNPSALTNAEAPPAAIPAKN